MNIEIERKFLVRDDSWRAAADDGRRYRQGYLCSEPGRTVRVRIGDEQAILAIKGKRAGLARPEFEYPIPLADAELLLDTCCPHPPVEKTRYLVSFGGLTWEVDEFSGANRGLILAEVELERVDQPVPLPPWAGREVTDDGRYYNAYLARCPYTQWPEQKA